MACYDAPMLCCIPTHIGVVTIITGLVLINSCRRGNYYLMFNARMLVCIPCSCLPYISIGVVTIIGPVLNTPNGVVNIGILRVESPIKQNIRLVYPGA